MRSHVVAVAVVEISHFGGMIDLDAVFERSDPEVCVFLADLECFVFAIASCALPKITAQQKAGTGHEALSEKLARRLAGLRHRSIRDSEGLNIPEEGVPVEVAVCQ